MITPATIMSSNRGTLVEVHIADLHFGANRVNPLDEYNILKNQFLDRLKTFRFDIVSINGDIFDHKMMSNSDGVLYAIKFVSELLDICRYWGATCIIISGTSSHDANQLKLFYHFLNDKTIDLRIIETIQFQYVKGARILCIPEEYGKSEEYYTNKLFRSGVYDTVFMHGTIVGSVYGANNEDLSNSKYPVFCLDSFALCKGPIFAGHVHTGGCFNSYMYYCSSPIRYHFGEEEDKGFIIAFHNLDTSEHYTYFNPILSYTYDTMNLDSIIMKDIKEIVDYIYNILNNGSDYLRVQFNSTHENIQILYNYFKTNKRVTIVNNINQVERERLMKDNTDILDKYKDISFILDPKMSEVDKFIEYINYKEGKGYMNKETLDSIMKGGSI